MEILSLGHSSWLLEMAAKGGRPVRILGDPWLSDFVVGDFMGRYPRLRFTTADLRPDAIFLSHSHTDHFDPETLVRLRSDLDPFPTIILPESLLYLEPLLAEHLDSPEILVLRAGRAAPLLGLELYGIYNPEPRSSNEDDVMALVVTSDREAFFAESDAVLPFYDEGFREWFSSRLFAGDPESIVFLTTENELAATMGSLAAADATEREAAVNRCLEEVCEQIDATYLMPQDPTGDLWASDRLVRLIGGQGICFPAELETEWNHVLFPIHPSERVDLERQAAEREGCRHAIEEFRAGAVHVVEGGALSARREAEWLTPLDTEDDVAYRPGVELFEDFPLAPLRDEERDDEGQAIRIAAALAERFLPWLIGTREPPLEELLTAAHGEYRLRIRYGTTERFRDADLVLGFREPGFVAEEAVGDPDEFYWANDIQDFLDGRADEFSLVCRRPLPSRAIRFWKCLGIPSLNRDLVRSKLDLHFRRARDGESNADWSLPMWE